MQDLGHYSTVRNAALTRPRPVRAFACLLVVLGLLGSLSSISEEEEVLLPAYHDPQKHMCRVCQREAAC